LSLHDVSSFSWVDDHEPFVRGAKNRRSSA
jgi:hypothetical protein